MQAKIKWAILGAARVNVRLLPAIVEAPNSQLVAVASRRAGAAKATLEKYTPIRMRDLFKAVKWIAEAVVGSKQQTASVGRSIKVALVNVDYMAGVLHSANRSRTMAL